jgi:hypothetical protein
MLNEEVANLEFRAVNGVSIVANSRGFEFTESCLKYEDLAGRQEKTETKLTRELQEVRSGLEITKANVEALRNTISNRQDSVPDLKATRSRLISVFKGDVLQSATETDYQIIASGNRFVHGGDALRDAADLDGQSGGRRDYNAYVKLYGFHPSIVQGSIGK